MIIKNFNTAVLNFNGEMLVGGFTLTPFDFFPERGEEYFAGTTGYLQNRERDYNERIDCWIRILGTIFRNHPDPSWRDDGRYMINTFQLRYALPRAKEAVEYYDWPAGRYRMFLPTPIGRMYISEYDLEEYTRKTGKVITICYVRS